MNALDRARLEFFAAFLMEYHRNEAALSDYAGLLDHYPIKADEGFFDPVVSENESLFVVSRTYSGMSARIRSSGYPTIYRELTEEIGASEFHIRWQDDEIVADAPSPTWFPLPKNWRWVRIGQEEESPEASAIDSSRWTGLPSGFKLTADKQKALVRDLDRVEEQLQDFNVGQEIRAQARAYVIAARILAEAPDPQADLIWEMIGRANALSGVASLFVAIISLFVQAAH
ncbi:MAG: hypothetical protein JF628_01580 [Sphingomonas sp.]|nr:hypothetical protein [Sphingomonas sp.]